MTMLHRLSILVLVLILQDDFASSEIHFKKGTPHVKLSNNALLSGTVDFSREGRPFHSFSGIPYGKVPERFGVAQPAPAWDGIFHATKNAEKKCLQISFDPDNPAPTGEEDCLVLNVFVPMNNTQRKGGLPVMMFIHGGGFAVGYGHEYGTHHLMDEDAIQVTINYRLGVLGFLSTGGDSVVPGNNALKDLVLGLRWIQDNIKKFGGDPGKVTIYGESAGAALVHYLLLSPTTEGLFHRAISQSGTALGPWAYNHNPRALAVKLATYMKCPTSNGQDSAITSEEIATCLRNVDSGELVIASTSLFPSWPPGSLDNILDFGPVAESSYSNNPFLTESPWKLLLDESAPLPNKNVPWFAGVTEDEGIFLMSPFLADENLYNELDDKWNDLIPRMSVLDRFIDGPEEAGIVAEKLRKFYVGDKAVSTESLISLTDLYSDCWFVHGARTAAIAAARKGAPVYMFQYAYPEPAPIINLFGGTVTDKDVLKMVAHGQDLITMFTVKSWFPGAEEIVKFDKPEDLLFSKNFIKLWVSIAIHGKPNFPWPTAKAEWKPVSKKELDGTKPLSWYRLTPSPEYTDDDQWKKPGTFSFWDKLYKDHFLSKLLNSNSGKGRKTEL